MATQEEATLEFPFEIFEHNEEQKKMLAANEEHHILNRFVQIGEKKWFAPATYKKYGPLFYNFEVRQDDVWLLGFLRSGTTVTQEIMWLICNNVNFEKAEQMSIRERFPSLEHMIYFNSELLPDHQEQNEIIFKSWKYLLQTKDRRFIKTHIPFELLPKNLLKAGCKVVYITRDPKEVIVSYYNIYKANAQKTIDIEFPQFWKWFKENLVIFAPYFEHIKEAWQKRNEKNLLIISYHELESDPIGTIKKIAQFLEKKLTDQQIESISNHCKNRVFTKTIKVTNNVEDSIKRTEFAKNSKWTQYFVDEMKDEVKEWIEQNLKDTDITFPN